MFEPKSSNLNAHIKSSQHYLSTDFKHCVFFNITFTPLFAVKDFGGSCIPEEFMKRQITYKSILLAYINKQDIKLTPGNYRFSWEEMWLSMLTFVQHALVG